MKNRLTDLNNRLFLMLEILLDEDLTDEELAAEIVRARAVADVAKTIIANGALVLSAQKAIAEGYLHGQPVPAMLESGK